MLASAVAVDLSFGEGNRPGVVVKLAALASVVFAVGCAQAFSVDADENADAGLGDDAVTAPDAALPASDATLPAADAAVITTVDAATPTIIDASPTPPSDASTTPDASPPPPDAATGGFCSSNADCPSSAQCCYFLVCVPGVEFGDLCFPE